MESSPPSKGGNLQQDFSFSKNPALDAQLSSAIQAQNISYKHRTRTNTIQNKAQDIMPNEVSSQEKTPKVLSSIDNSLIKTPGFEKRISDQLPLFLDQKSLDQNSGPGYNDQSFAKKPVVFSEYLDNNYNQIGNIKSAGSSHKIWHQNIGNSTINSQQDRNSAVADQTIIESSEQHGGSIDQAHIYESSKSSVLAVPASNQQKIELKSQFENDDIVNRLRYEKMPVQEPEMDSARLTVDLNRNRLQTQAFAHMTQDFDIKSDGTIVTISQSGKNGNIKQFINSSQAFTPLQGTTNQDLKIAIGSESNIQLFRGMQQEMTTPFVANSTELQEEQVSENSPVSKFKIKTEVDDRNGKKTVIHFKQNHQQSQSLERLPSFIELNQNQDGPDSQMQNIGIETQSMAPYIKFEQVSRSEFAETQAQAWDPILVQSRQQPEISVTNMYKNSECGAETVQEDSITDTNMQETKTQQMVPKVLKSNQGAASEMGENASATEHAPSQPAEIDPRKSDRVNVGSFEEEKSVDWQNKMSSAHGSIFSRAEVSGTKPQQQVTNVGTATFAIDKREKEAMSADYSNINLYESNDGRNGGEGVHNLAQFVDQGFNASQDCPAQDHSGMFIIEEQVRHMNSAMPNYEETQPTYLNTNDRVIKSFDIKQGQAAGHSSITSSSNEGSIKESGVEQYESDDAEDKNQQYTSSALQTSITREGVVVMPGFSSAPNQSAFETQRYEQDSMAFDTIQVQTQEISMPHEQPSLDKKEFNEEEDSEQEPKDPVYAHNSAISVQDDTEESYDDPHLESADKILDENAEPGEVITRDDFFIPDSNCASMQRMPNDGNIFYIEQENLVSRTSREEQFANPEEEFTAIRTSSKKIVKIKFASKRKNRRSSVKRNSKSPADPNRNSKSPPQKRVVIRDGRIILTNNRNNQFDQLQFPIRKSNYDHRTVEQMILGLDQFRDSVQMMHKMKNRISKYNKDIVPKAQQYYVARQVQMQTQSQMESGTGIPMANMSIQDDRTVDNLPSHRSKLAMTPECTNEESNIITLQDQESMLTETNLPQFMRDISRPRKHNDILLKDQPNIKSDNQSNFQVQRLCNYQNNFEAVVNQSHENREASREQVLSQYSDQLIDHFKRSHPVERELVSQQVIRQSSDISKINITKSRTQNRRKVRISASSQENMPDSASEYRFRTKGNNKRLMMVNKEHGRQTVPMQIDQEIQKAYNYSQAAKPNYNMKSERSSFYPQDNLSQLLHPESAYPVNDGSLFNRVQASLASKFAHNQILTHRTITKNRTIGNIYNRSKARNIITCVGANNKMKWRKNSQENIHSSTMKQQIQSDFMPENMRLLQQEQSSDVGSIFCREDNNSNLALFEKIGGGSLEVIKSDSKQPTERSIISQHYLGPQQKITDFQPEKFTDPQVQFKFKKWLDKGRPTTIGGSIENSLRAGDRRNVSRLISNSVEVSEKHNLQFNPLPQSAILQQLQNARLNTQDNNEKQVIFEDDMLFEQDEACEQDSGRIPIAQPTSQKMNLSLALKFLNDPSYGDTVEQRKANLLSFLEQNFPSEFIRMSQSDVQTLKISQTETGNGSLGDVNTIFSSIDEQQNRSNQASRYAVERKPEKILVQNSIGCADMTYQVLAESNQIPHSLPTGSPNQMRFSHDAQLKRTLDQKMMKLLKASELPISQINHLTQIYAVPQGKQRSLFLKNNYTKSGRLIQQHINKTNKLVEIRKSRSPKPEEGFDETAVVKVSPCSYLKRQTQHLSGRHSKPSNSNQKSGTVTQKSTARSLKQTGVHQNHKGSDKKPIGNQVNPQVEGFDVPYEGRPQSRLHPHDAAIRHQMHLQNVEALEREDTFEHPQISLSMPQSQMSSQSKLQDKLDDKTKRNQKPQPQTDVIDLLQEQYNIQSKDSLEQEDQIQGEETIIGDTASPSNKQQQVYTEEGKIALSTDRKGYQIDDLERVRDLYTQNGATPAHENETPQTLLAKVSHNVHSHHGLVISVEEGDDEDIYENEFTLAKFDDSKNPNQQEDDLVVQQQDVVEGKPIEEVDDSEDYYADDKFVYEDIGEDPSSDDPEQKFLKEHALKTARRSGGEEDENQEMVGDSLNQNSIEVAIRDNRRTSQSHMAESRDKDDFMSQTHKGAANGNEQVSDDQNDNDDDKYSEN